MANREENLGGSSNPDFTLKAMQQQFERLNVILGSMSDRLDRQEERLTNLQNRESNDGSSSSRRNRRDHGDSQDDVSEGENGGETEEEHNFVMGRNRMRGGRHQRNHRRFDHRDEK